jgi:hypothetical protein
MGTVYTGQDSIGLYASGDPASATLYRESASLGGAMLQWEVQALDYVPDTAIEGVAVQYISGANGTGYGYIRAASASSLAYTAPGSNTEGAAVTVANGGSATLIDGADTSKYIRVYRDSAVAMGGRMRINIVKPLNNVLGQSDLSNAERVAGKTSYRAAFLLNRNSAACTNVKLWIRTLGTQRTSNSAQLSSSGGGTITTTGSLADWPEKGFCHIKTSGGTTREIVRYTSRTDTSLTIDADGREMLGTTAAAGANDDTIVPVPPIAIWLQAPDSEGTIELPADETTEPTAPTWNYGCTEATAETLASLAAGAWYGLRVKREIPANGPGFWGYENSIWLKFTTGGNTYTQPLSGFFREANTDIAEYLAYVGDGVMPDFDASPAATSATLPVTYSLPLPGAGLTKTYYACLRQRDKYGLIGRNQYSRRHVIDENGDDVTPEVSAPVNATLTNTQSGEVILDVWYYPDQDSDPADTWLIYVSTDGTNPDPDTDTPTEIGMVSGFGLRPYFHLNRVLGPYAFGTDLRVLPRVMRGSDDTESTNTTPVTTTISTAEILRPGFAGLFLGEAYGQTIAPILDDTYYIPGTSNGAYLRSLPGESQLWADSKLVWRCVFDGMGAKTWFIPSGWDLESTTVSGAGASTWYEVVSWTGGDKRIAICVNSQRVAMIDVTNDVIQWAGRSAGETLSSHPNPENGVWSHPDSSGVSFHVLDAATQTMRAFLKITSAGMALYNTDLDRTRS